jgi:hypothetical protein
LIQQTQRKPPNGENLIRSHRTVIVARDMVDIDDIEQAIAFFVPEP